jgi:hypothetical protein
MGILAAISWVAASLYVLFKTSAVEEYIKIIPLPESITHLKEYKKEKEFDYSLSYKLFILTSHDNFLNRLVTCPYCTGLWLSCGFSYVFSCIKWIPAVYLGAMAVYLTASAFFSWLERVQDYDTN